MLCTRSPGVLAVWRPGWRSELAAGARVREVCDRDAGHLVQSARRFADVDVLYDLLRLGEADRAARAIDLRFAHRLVEAGFILHVALHRLEPDAKQLRRIVALDRVNVRLTIGLGLEGGAECIVLWIVDAVAVMQRGLDALGGCALRTEYAFGQEA